MKIIKNLLILFIFTLIISNTGAGAVVGKFVAYVKEEKVPHLSGTWETREFIIPLTDGFKHHWLTNVSCDDKISVRVRNVGDPIVNGNYYELVNGQDLQLTNDKSPYSLWTLGGHFTLQFKTDFFTINDRYVHYADWVLVIP